MILNKVERCPITPVSPPHQEPWDRTLAPRQNNGVLLTARTFEALLWALLKIAYKALEVH